MSYLATGCNYKVSTEETFVMGKTVSQQVYIQYTPTQIRKEALQKLENLRSKNLEKFKSIRCFPKEPVQMIASKDNNPIKSETVFNKQDKRYRFLFEKEVEAEMNQETKAIEIAEKVRLKIANIMFYEAEDSKDIKKAHHIAEHEKNELTKILEFTLQETKRALNVIDIRTNIRNCVKYENDSKTILKDYVILFFDIESEALEFMRQLETKIFRKVQKPTFLHILLAYFLYFM